MVLRNGNRLITNSASKAETIHKNMGPRDNPAIRQKIAIFPFPIGIHPQSPLQSCFRGRVKSCFQKFHSINPPSIVQTLKNGYPVSRSLNSPWMLSHVPPRHLVAVLTDMITGCGASRQSQMLSSLPWKKILLLLHDLRSVVRQRSDVHRATALARVVPAFYLRFIPKFSMKSSAVWVSPRLGYALLF